MKSKFNFNAASKKNIIKNSEIRSCEKIDNEHFNISCTIENNFQSEQCNLTLFSETNTEINSLTKNVDSSLESSLFSNIKLSQCEYSETVHNLTNNSETINQIINRNFDYIIPDQVVNEIKISSQHEQPHVNQNLGDNSNVKNEFNAESEAVKSESPLSNTNTMIQIPLPPLIPERKEKIIESKSYPVKMKFNFKNAINKDKNKPMKTDENLATNERSIEQISLDLITRNPNYNNVDSHREIEVNADVTETAVATSIKKCKFNFEKAVKKNSMELSDLIASEFHENFNKSTEILNGNLVEIQSKVAENPDKNQPLQLETDSNLSEFAVNSAAQSAQSTEPFANDRKSRAYLEIIQLMNGESQEKVLMKVITKPIGESPVGNFNNHIKKPIFRKSCVNSVGNMVNNNKEIVNFSVSRSHFGQTSRLATDQGYSLDKIQEDKIKKSPENLEEIVKRLQNSEGKLIEIRESFLESNKNKSIEKLQEIDHYDFSVDEITEEIIIPPRKSNRKLKIQSSSSDESSDADSQNFDKISMETKEKTFVVDGKTKEIPKFTGKENSPNKIDDKKSNEKTRSKNSLLENDCNQEICIQKSIKKSIKPPLKSNGFEEGQTIDAINEKPPEGKTNLKKSAARKPKLSNNSPRIAENLGELPSQSLSETEMETSTRKSARLSSVQETIKSIDPNESFTDQPEKNTISPYAAQVSKSKFNWKNAVNKSATTATGLKLNSEIQICLSDIMTKSDGNSGSQSNTVTVPVALSKSPVQRKEIIRHAANPEISKSETIVNLSPNSVQIRKRKEKKIVFKLNATVSANDQIDLSSLTLRELINNTPQGPPPKSRLQGKLNRPGKPENSDGNQMEHDRANIQQGQQQQLVKPKSRNFRIDLDGQIVIDEEEDDLKTPLNTEGMEEIVENAADLKSTYRSYTKRRLSGKRWSMEETKNFYRALLAVKTDFTRMETIFRGRSRADLQKKFKVEEKLNPKYIDEILMNRVVCDISNLMFDSHLKSNTKKSRPKQDAAKRYMRSHQQSDSDSDSVNPTPPKRRYRRFDSETTKIPSDASILPDYLKVIVKVDK